MIELPEAHVLADQINETLKGKVIQTAVANASPHAFAQYTGDPAGYQARLGGKQIANAKPHAGSVEILAGDMLMVISTPIKYHAPGEKPPAKHQLLLEFADASHMSCTVAMWGAMYCFSLAKGEVPEEYSKDRAPDPLTAAFDEAYFGALWSTAKSNLSAKAFLATEQRIPGLGNGVLQDILFNAGIHPKRKLQSIGQAERRKLYDSVKATLADMRARGGRDTERDLFGAKGGYKTILSANTAKEPCPACGGPLIREAYLGGNIYYCPKCQPL